MTATSQVAVIWRLLLRARLGWPAVSSAGLNSTRAGRSPAINR